MRRTFLLPTLALLLIACDAPGVDGDNAPAPTGLLEGSILYSGPRPACLRDADGTAVRAMGQVVLTAFAYDNPPPPEGSATGAANVLTLPASQVFPDVADCLPLEPGPEDAEPVIRSVPFAWPGLALGRDYQIRGFFDRDQDFVPFFSVRNLPTREDIAGGAFVDPAAARRQYYRVSFDAPEARPDGQRLTGVVVSLGAPVNTERPAFRLGDATRPLDSAATIPPDPNPVTREAALWQQTEATLEWIDPAAPGYADALDAAGLEFDDHPVGRAWYVRPVDADGDGAGDPHPILGDDVPWTTPMWILERARTPAEVAAGLPRVRLVGSTRPTRTLVKKVFAPSIEMFVPPVAVMYLDPADPACRVAVLAPGNLVDLYERAPADCRELPTGVYSQSVLHGVAGARPVDGADPTVSDTGWTLEGGAFSGQAWSVPNELGPPDRTFDPAAVHQLPVELQVAEQGPDGRFVVSDGDPQADAASCTQAPDPALAGAPRDIQFLAPPAGCCEAVQHLCGLPLCAPEELRPGVWVRSPRTDADGLSCLPFSMPAACCG